MSNLLTYFAHVLLHIVRIYAHILHHCIPQLQIVLLTPYLTLNVCYPPPVMSGPIALIKLNTHKKKKKKNTTPL